MYFFFLSLILLWTIICFITFIVALDLDFRLSGANLFYLGRLEGKTIIKLLYWTFWKSRLCQLDRCFLFKRMFSTSFFSSSNNTIFLILLDGCDSFMARIDFVATKMTSIAELSINSEINGMRLCRLLGFKRVWLVDSCLLLRFLS